MFTGGVYQIFFKYFPSKLKEAFIDLGYIETNLMVFYKGALSVEALDDMPIDRKLRLNKRALKLAKEIERQHGV